jgi:hypothetical protein
VSVTQIWRALGAPVELRYLDVPFEELWRRVEARNEQAESGAGLITRAEMEEYAGICQAPDAEELAQYDRPGAALRG